MLNLEKMWRYILSLKPHDEPATEEVLVLQRDLIVVDWTNIKLSKFGCIDDEIALLLSTPMGMRSVHKYQACVDPDKQNMQMMTKFETLYLFVKVDSDQTGINRIYRDGIRAVVDGIQGQIGISCGWHRPDQYLSVINGDLSFYHSEAGKQINADSGNPVGKNDKGTRFILDAYALDALEIDARQWSHSLDGCYFQGALPGYFFLAHQDLKSGQTIVKREDRYMEIGAQKALPCR